MNNAKLVSLILRIGLASVFLYAAVAATIQPDNWIGFIPQFLRDIFPQNILLFGFSAYQFMLGIWILSNWKIFFSSILAAITIAGIIAANFGALDITFRDFTIFFTALALVVANFKKKK
ncbi:MAG TPA: hypothetical protein VF820_07250 [Patescibacteria group bacterium]